ncbi:OmpA family protein [Meridianimarinicoccus roseus]|uniref:OmpA family protein n=1 Tax=Meridianimarinicoccus roseus TaxID=2072018 RepID=A0A2V2LD51_9RHOB|nr:OmpA family protein [Meridianimarinicoccus roseus]PWR01216.1 OmpA family protein [Meridianimarinicoccus roseus]
MKRLSVLLVCLCALAPAAHAQGADGATMTEEQILERFNKQKTRGLSIAPVSGGAAQAAAPAATADTTVTADSGTRVGFDTLPPEEQVNINISFDFDSAALREDQKPKLATLCKVMTQIDVQVFRILGHTDASGSEAYNERLSRLRAEEVKRFLVSDCGIAAERLQAVGVGERAPIVPEDPNADANRRVEFQVLG